MVKPLQFDRPQGGVLGLPMFRHISLAISTFQMESLGISISANENFFDYVTTKFTLELESPFIQKGIYVLFSH